MIYSLNDMGLKQADFEGKKQCRFSLRMPEDLMRKLEKEASVSNPKRSINALIIEKVLAAYKKKK